MELHKLPKQNLNLQTEVLQPRRNLTTHHARQNLHQLHKSCPYGIHPINLPPEPERARSCHDTQPQEVDARHEVQLRLPFNN